MTENHDDQQPLEPEELDQQNGETLPDREAMSVIGDPSQWTLPPVIETDPGYTQPIEPPATE